MQLTGAQPHPRKCSTFAVFSSLTIFLVSLAVAPLHLSSPTLPFSSPCLSFSQPTRTPQNRNSASPDSPWLRTVRTPLQTQLPNQSGNGPTLRQRKCRWYRFSTDSQPICNRFPTVFQPIFNRAPQPQPFCNRFSTARQTRNRFSTVFQPFFNRFSTDFQPIFNRLRNRFSTVF